MNIPAVPPPSPVVYPELRAERLAELSRKARRGQASAQELLELDRLEEPPAAAP